MLQVKKLLRPTLISRIGLKATVRNFSVTRPTLDDQGEEEGKKGFLKSVLYGKDEHGATVTGDNTTHSKQLARGKYVHEMQSKYRGNK